MIKKIDWLRPFKWLWNKFRLILSIVLILLCSLIVYQNVQMKKQRVFNMHQESFDLTRIPSGMVVWSHGVPGMEADFKFVPQESLRYRFFDVAILTPNKIIHVVRLPYYVMGVINPNGVIDFKNKKKKNGKNSNLGETFYVYPYENEKKLKNL